MQIDESEMSHINLIRDLDSHMDDDVAMLNMINVG